MSGLLMLLLLLALGTSEAAGTAGPSVGSPLPATPARPVGIPAAARADPDVLRLGPLGSIVVELHLGAGGVDALRVGRRVTEAAGPGGRATDWHLPTGDAVLLEGRWWSPMERPRPAPWRSPTRAQLAAIRSNLAPTDDGRGRDRLYGAALGDVTGDGRADLVVAFRRPFRRTLINATRRPAAWRDAAGMSAHLGVYRPGTLRESWVAGTLVLPVVRLAVCDEALAVAYGSLRRRGIVATGAWRWQGFGFLPSEPLPGGGRPACVDMDGDGRLEPAVLGREGP